MDAMTDRPNKILSSSAKAARAMALALSALVVPPPALGDPSDASLGLMISVAASGVAVSVKVGGPQGALLGFATMSATSSVLIAGITGRGVFSLRTPDGTGYAEFDVPPERLRAVGIKSGDPVEIHRAPAGWRMSARGQDIAYFVDETGTALLNSSRR